jgi:hypothetical protein
LQVAYNKHFEVCTKFKKLNKKLFKKLNVVILENKNLLSKFYESSSIAWLIDSFGDCSNKIIQCIKSSLPLLLRWKVCLVCVIEQGSCIKCTIFLGCKLGWKGV